MFIWTIGDIAAVAILAFLVIAAICGYVSSSLEVSKPEREAAARKEEERKRHQKEAERDRRDAPAWMIALGAAIFLAICLLFAK